MSSKSLELKVRALVESTIQKMGFDLVSVEHTTGNRRPLLRLSIDKAGGVGADDCASVSRRVSLLLDEADPIDSAYDLEVSSPGMDRPVQRLEDFQRFIGYRVKVRMEPGRSRRRFTGRIERVVDDIVVLMVDGEEFELDFDGVEQARLVLTLEEYEAFKDGLPALGSEE